MKSPMPEQQRDATPFDMQRRAWIWLVVAVTALTIMMSLAAIVLSSRNGLDLRDILADVGWQGAITISLLAVLIVLHHPYHPLGWIFSIIAFTQGLLSVSVQYARYAFFTMPGSLPFAGVASWLGQVAWVPAIWLMLTYVLQLFPTGRLLSARWRILFWVSPTPIIIYFFLAVWLWQHRGLALYSPIPDTAPVMILILWQVFLPALLLCGVASMASLIVRFRRAVAVEREQIKWMAYAAFLVFVTSLLDNATPLGPLLARFKLEFILTAFNALPIPIAVGVAILRYRLWDIDIIVRRTLVYSILTAVLAVVYFGIVASTQQVVRAITGQTSDLAIVISTLAVAVLFAPMRRRIQDVIDQRLYRRKYNATKMLESFAISARDEVDATQLVTRLIDVVQDTLQPEHLSLWLSDAIGRNIADTGAAVAGHTAEVKE